MHAEEEAQLRGIKVSGSRRHGTPGRGSSEKQAGIAIRQSEREDPAMQEESGSTPGSLECVSPLSAPEKRKNKSATAKKAKACKTKQKSMKRKNMQKQKKRQLNCLCKIRSSMWLGCARLGLSLYQRRRIERCKKRTLDTQDKRESYRK